MNLQINNLTKNYQLKQKQVNALRGISYTFPSKGMVFVVGKSGSGKSTLLNILGLLDGFDSGDYIINGKSTADFSEAEKNAFRAQNIGFVFQEFHIIEKYSIAQNVALSLEISNSDIDSKRVNSVLEQVGLKNYENRKSGKISGGQKQRVAIARAIIKDPDIILADEPTGSLDSVTGTEIFNILQELSKEKLVIVISHDIESANKYADKIIELKDGLIDSVYDGDGGAESVKFVVDKVQKEDINKYNAILNEGKKVVFAKPKQPKPTHDDTQIQAPKPLKSKVKLPIKNAFKLSLMSVKTKWARTLFMVLITMFAVAFFGFNDIIAQFDKNELIVQALTNEGAHTVDVGVERVHNQGIIESYNTTNFTPERTELYKTLELGGYERRPFAVYGSMCLKNYTTLLPNGGSQFFYDGLATTTECPDVTKIGLKLIAGRQPVLTDEKGIYEILITTYHLKTYEIFGYQDWGKTISIDSVTDFSQLEGKYLDYFWSGTATQIKFRIVGLVEVDFSKYEQFAEIDFNQRELTDEQEVLLSKFSTTFNDYNTIFVADGFYEKFEQQTRGVRTYYDAVRINNVNLGLERGSFMVIDEDVFSKNGHYVYLKEGINSLEDFDKNQIIVSTGMLKELFLDYHNYYEQIDYIIKQVEDSGILGSEISVRYGHYDAFQNTRNSRMEYHKFEIVGVLFADGNISAVTNNVLNNKFDKVYDFRVPAFTKAEKAQIVQILSDYGTFYEQEHDRYFRFSVRTEDYYAIRSIDSYFTLFVNIFSVLSIILCVFAIVLTYAFISHSVHLRKKDIGILRSLGASKADVAGIFIIEGALIVALEIILGVATCFAGFSFLQSYFLSKMGDLATQYTIVKFGFRQVALMSLSAIFSVAISIIVPIIRIANKQPMDAIKE